MGVGVVVAVFAAAVAEFIAHSVAAVFDNVYQIVLAECRQCAENI